MDSVLPQPNSSEENIAAETTRYFEEEDFSKKK
jgi:hypothetical protein